MSHWEMGSEFHWDTKYLKESAAIESYSTIEGCRLLTSGRAAFALLAQSFDSRKTLHLPSYFCQDVTDYISSYFDIKWYSDLPTFVQPEFDSIAATPGDIVLAVNYFAMRQSTIWESWRITHPDVIILEDHTHDPYSNWSKKSAADYCLASLRKTLPLPDGAVLWSPKGLPMASLSGSPSKSCALKLTSMIMKSAYLSGAPIPKESFRTLQLVAEAGFADHSALSPSPFTQAMVDVLDVEKLRALRLRNVQQFFQSLDAGPCRKLRGNWPTDSVPFNGVVLCESSIVREKLRKHLTSNGVYTAIHWEQSLTSHVAERELSERIITIPLDFRYNTEDVSKVVDLIHRFARI